MSVEIPAEQLAFVHHVIASGTYASEADVVSAALGLLQERERRRAELREELRPALERLDRGAGKQLDIQELKREELVTTLSSISSGRTALPSRG